MDIESLRTKAKALGLEKVVDAHPEDLRKALEKGADLTGKLPQDLHWSVEPATSFRCTPVNVNNQ